MPVFCFQHILSNYLFYSIPKGKSINGNAQGQSPKIVPPTSTATGFLDIGDRYALAICILLETLYVCASIRKRAFVRILKINLNLEQMR